MDLDLTDNEAEALAQELSGIVNYARYPLSPRVQMLQGVRAKLRPDPAQAAASGVSGGIGEGVSRPQHIVLFR
jgi:hypothetical protein